MELINIYGIELVFSQMILNFRPLMPDIDLAVHRCSSRPGQAGGAWGIQSCSATVSHGLPLSISRRPGSLHLLRTYFRALHLALPASLIWRLMPMFCHLGS